MELMDRDPPADAHDAGLWAPALMSRDPLAGAHDAHDAGLWAPALMARDPLAGAHDAHDAGLWPPACPNGPGPPG